MANVNFKGKVTTTGNSEALRFEKSLFKSLPKFANGAPLTARRLADDVLIIHVDMPDMGVESDRDPVMDAFLSFVEQDILDNPQAIQPIAQSEMDEIADLVKGVSVDE
ncbi:hypothetical protein MNBD_GAMMA12-601 [hydrothermal vent metagenome]|uniref:Uncharacterized protein n=1 Tax=hydrothermal vent metagenome TaxID=652676 RepID=A0A3B0Z5H5_9ZZZZ